jgi:probable rRNA maturation factor
MISVQLTDARRNLRSTARRLVKAIQKAASSRWNKAELSLAVVDGREMVALNRRYTGRRGQTDVLAFLFDEKSWPEQGAVGEIIVNASLAAKEARSRGVAPEAELALYAIHGTLHLLGFDDHDPVSRRRMYNEEKRLLESFGIPFTRDSRVRKNVRSHTGAGGRNK